MAPSPNAIRNSLSLLYGPSALDLYCDQFKPGMEGTIAQFVQLRINEPGALDRIDRYIDQIEGLRRVALRLREALKRESTAEVAPDAAA